MQMHSAVNGRQLSPQSGKGRNEECERLIG
jgi:hypothetical protein